MQPQPRRAVHGALSPRQRHVWAGPIDEIIAERPLFELYDLRADPFERVNLFDHPAAQVMRADLARRLRNWMTETRNPLLDGPIASPYYRDSLQRLFQL